MYHTKIQIRFSDCDMLKHVNNAVYLQYFEIARMQFLNQELPNWDWDKEGIILANNSIDYILPLFLDDDCHINVFCEHIGKSSFKLGYKVEVKTASKTVTKAKGSSVLVCFDFRAQKTMPIPTNLKQVLEKSSTLL